ncbi:hypothetical protein CC86DRAFT_264536, partial [Ophiobolus disseminans]
LLWESGFGSDVKKNKEHASTSGEKSLVSKRRPMDTKRSASDHLEGQAGTATSTPVAVRQRIERDRSVSKIRHHTRVTLNPPRPTAQRACSSSQVELRSRHHDAHVSSEALQRELKAPFYTRYEGSEELVGKDVVLDWYALSLRNSDSKTRAQPRTDTPALPLKTCLRTKAKSTTTTPPNEIYKDGVADSENKTLRRVKTVDFEGPTKSLLTIPALTGPSKEVMHVAGNRTETLHSQPMNPNNTPRFPSYPGALITAKSTLAGPATTRTDVHVIAIAPSCDLERAANHESIDPATPTMQIVESNTGSYEVTWDTVPPEHANRRSSSASHSLYAVSSTATRGLQRVNSKLTDWSGTWNSLSDSFKPTIVVFPDEDGRMRPHFECVVEDEDLVALAPPNSQRTSVAPSRHPSRPSSVPLTRSASQEEIQVECDPLEYSQEQHVPPVWITPIKSTRTMSDPEIRPYSTDSPPSPFMVPDRVSHPTYQPRTISNFDDERFRGHRDSVTLARSRLLHATDLGQIVHAHRDSLSLARRRM